MKGKSYTFARAAYQACISFIFGTTALWIVPSGAQAQFPFVQRQTWDGPYDIEMIAAPNLDAVYLDDTQAAAGKLLADSLITYNTMIMTGRLLDINNDYKGGSPFNQVKIPLQAVLCNDPLNGCGTLGLPTASPSSSCPQKFESPTDITKYVSMTYADYDSDNSTFSSSMAELSISSCSEIEAAYLYWTGMFQGSNPPITLLNGPLDSYTGGADVFNVGSGSGYDQVLLKIPGGNYQSVTSDVTRTTSLNYLCVSDVTNIVKGSGGGQFWVADVQSYPNEGTGGSSSGWVLVVVFRSPLSPPRLISLWDGLESISSGNSQTFTLTGLQTPATNNFNSYVGFAVLDGENIAAELKGATPEGLGFQTNNGGAYESINPFATDQPPYKLWTKKGYPSTCGGSNNISGCKAPLFDSNWCTVYDGISSSHITTYNPTTGTNGNEIVRLPSNKNTLGLDVHNIKLPNGSVAPGATQATLTVQAGPQGGTNPFLAYIAIERLQPKLEMTKMANKNSTQLNTQIQYTLRIINQGNAPSLGDDIVYDTLDIATYYVTGSLASIAYQSGVATSPAGVSMVSSTNGDLQLKLSNPIQPGDSVDITFSVQVVDYAAHTNLWDVQCKRSILNTAYVDYNTLSSGILESKSNANDCGIGSETSVLVFDPQLGSAMETQLGPFAACSLATDSVRPKVKAELLNAGVAPADISEYDIRDSSYTKVQLGKLFGSIVDTVTYYAIRNYNTSGNCQQIYKLDFYCNPCSNPLVTSDSTDTICSGTALNYTITSNVASATYSWDRAAVSGISEAGVTGKSGNPITEALTDTTSAPVVVSYVITPSANGCKGPSFTYKVTVNPLPSVTSKPADTICSGTALNYAITGNVSSSSYSWSRAAVSGISEAAVTGQSSDPITETLTDTTSGLATALYTITPSANGCTGAPFTYKATVKPAPLITSRTKDTICSGTALNYTITSNVTSATFSWDRAALSGISQSGVTDQNSNPISETLIDTTSSPVTAGYNITPTANGCVGAPFTYKVTVNPIPSVTSRAKDTICSGTALNYTIKSDVPSATFTWGRAAVSGISEAGVTGQSGNPITETLTDTTSGLVSVTYTITPSANGCTGSPFTYKATVKPLPSVTSKANDTVCSGTSQNYTITSNVSSATYTWDRVAVSGISESAVTGQSNNPITESLTNTTSGSVVASYSITPTANGCQGSPFTYNVTVNPIPAVTSASTNTICSGTAQNYTITSNVSSATYTWDRAAVSGISESAVTGQSSNPITESLTNTTSVSVVVSYSITPTASGCQGSPFAYNVRVNPIPAVTSASTNTICSGTAQNYTITSNVSSATYTWDRVAVSGISESAVTGQSNNPITESLTNTTSGSVVVSYSITPTANSCSGTPFTYQVTINPPTRITLQPVSQNLCGGEMLTLQTAATGTGTLLYQWKLDGQDLSGETSASLTITDVTSSNAGTYTVTVTGDCGSLSSTSALVQVTTPPLSTLQVDGARICQGQGGMVVIHTTESGIGYQAFIGNNPVSDKGTGNGGSLDLSIQAYELSAGKNTIHIHAYGCHEVDLTDTATIQVDSVPVADAGPDIQIHDYGQVTLDGSGSSQGGYSYAWSTTNSGVTLSDPVAIKTSADVEVKSVTIQLNVSVSGNTTCSATDEVQIKLVPQPVKIPNAFSPNGDGVHDLFEIRNIKFFNNAILYVYNQWGELIFRSKPGYINPWDGKRNGQDVPVSAYYYVLELNESGFKSMAGDITLIR